MPKFTDVVKNAQAAGTITGQELFPIIQDGVTKHITVAALQEGPFQQVPATINKIWPTVGPPARSLGVNGDYAVDTYYKMFYGPKANNSWPAGFSISGSSFLAAGMETNINGIVKGNGSVVSAAVAADFPTLNQNTTGTAAGLSATLAVGSGGTGSTNGSITGTGALTFTAGGSNQNVNLVPSGTGSIVGNAPLAQTLTVVDTTGAYASSHTIDFSTTTTAARAGYVSNFYGKVHVPTGVTNSAGFYGLAGAALRGYVAGTDDNGTLGSLYGLFFTPGHLNVNTTCNPVTNNVYGIRVTTYISRGTIVNNYALYLNTSSLSTPSAWQANHSYAAGALCIPSTPNGYWYVCSVAGTSGASEPSPWNTTPSGTTSDNAVTWYTLTIPSITNNYGVYQSDSTAMNYFNGPVGIGTSTNDGVNKLNVVGSIKSTGRHIASTVTALTPGSTVALDASLGDYFTLTPAQDCTINLSNSVAGQSIKLKILTSGTTSYTITFGTDFISTGTLATGTTDAHTIDVTFACYDGTNYCETGRVGVSVSSGTGLPSGGTAGQVLSKIDGTDYNTQWIDSSISGTVFPGSPVTNQRFFRTDRGIEYYYNGTRWLSTQEFILPLRISDTLEPLTATSTLLAEVIEPGANGIYITSSISNTYVVTTNDGSHYWTLQLQYLPATGSAVAVGDPFNTSGDAANTNVRHAVTIGVVLNTAGLLLNIKGTKTSTPGNLYLNTVVFYRRIG